MAALFYDAAYLIPCSLTAVMLFFLYRPHGPVPGVVSVLIASAVCSVFWILLRRARARIRVVVFGIALAFWAGFFISTDYQKREIYLQEHLWILGVVLVCLGCLVFEVLAQHFVYLRPVAILAGLAYFAFCLIKNVTPGKTIALSVLFYMVFAVAEQIQKKWIKEGDTDLKPHLALLLPYILLLFLVLSLIRMPIRSYDWNFVKKTVEKVKSGYEVMMSYFESDEMTGSVANVGFSGNARILGRLGRGNYEVLRISTDLPKNSGVYLSGESFDFFDGRVWAKTDDSGMNYGMLDILETLAAIQKHDGEHVSDYIARNQLRISCIGTRTERVFLPSKAVPALYGERAFLKGGDLVFDRKKQAEYKVDFFRLNVDHERIDELLSTPEALNEKDLEEAKSLLSRRDASGYNMNDLNAYRERIKEVYGASPVLSDEMCAFLDNELAGADSDHEKLQRIAALFSGIAYTKNPGELPRNVKNEADFLDWFLLDAQTGYCTHYATAFVLMARYAGIPARYMQGYCFHAMPGEFAVSSAKAHAWAQAYIEGYGWLDLDATPSRRAAIGWAVAGDEDYEAEREEEEPLPDEAEPVLDKTGVLFKLRLPLILAVSFILLFVLFDRLIRSYRFKKADTEGKIRILWERNLRILKRLGYRIGFGETLREFAARALTDVSSEGLAFIPVYERLIYAHSAAEEADVELFLSCQKQLKGRLSAKRRERFWIGRNKKDKI